MSNFFLNIIDKIECIFGKNKSLSEKEKLRLEMLEFSKEHAVDLYNLLIQVEKRKNEISEKRQKLVEVLKKVKKDARSDETIVFYDKLLPELVKQEKKIKHSINEAYVKYEKFLLNPSNYNYEEELKIITQNTIQANSDIEEHYKKTYELNSESKI